MKQKFWQNHIVLILLCWLVALATLQSRWVVGLFSIPSIVSKVAAVLSYAPFLLLTLWKVAGDLKKPPKDLFSLVFYVFCIYYFGITVYRVLTHGEIKENLYYSAVCLGSISLFCLIHDKKIQPDAHALIWDLCVFAGILLVYRFVHTVFLSRWLWYSPVNEIALGAMVLLLLPFAFYLLRGCAQNRKNTIFGGVLIFGSLLLCLTLSSRAVFLFMLLALVLMFLTCLRSKPALLTAGCAVVLALAVLFGLFALNVGNVRYALYRETGFSALYTPNASPSVSPNKTQTSNNNVPMEDAAAQINRSDSMRENLIRFSLEEFRKNPLIGTGNVLFAHNYNSFTEIVQAPAHNMVLQTLNCYGLIGLLLLVALVITLLLKIRLFRIKEGAWGERLSLLAIFLIYFGMSMYQATAYDILVMPTMFACIAAFAGKLQDHAGAKE